MRYLCVCVTLCVCVCVAVDGGAVRDPGEGGQAQRTHAVHRPHL